MNKAPLHKSRLVAGGACLALALALAACGGGDTAAPPAAPPAAPDTAQAQTAEFCRTAVAIDKTFSSAPPPAALPPEQAAAVYQQIGAALDPMLTQAEQQAPAEVTGDVGTVARLTRQALTAGDFALLESPEYTTATTNLDRYQLDNCGFDRTDVTAVNFEFQGLPDDLGSGIHAITLTNEGDQLHEIAIVRINDGVTTPIDELLTQPMDQLLAQVEIAGLAAAPPGATDTAFVDLAPGRYFAACFIPEGTTADAEGSGPPHFVLGMLKEFPVA